MLNSFKASTTDTYLTIATKSTKACLQIPTNTKGSKDTNDLRKYFKLLITTITAESHSILRSRDKTTRPTKDIKALIMATKTETIRQIRAQKLQMFEAHPLI